MCGLALWPIIYLGLTFYQTDYAFVCDILPQFWSIFHWQPTNVPVPLHIMTSNFFDEMFHNHWIGRDVHVCWPSWSPNLTPMDFLLWGEMKHLVYETSLDTEEKLVTLVAAAAIIIFQTPEIFQRTTQSLVRSYTFVLKSMVNYFNNVSKWIKAILCGKGTWYIRAMTHPNGKQIDVYMVHKNWFILASSFIPQT